MPNSKYPQTDIYIFSAEFLKNTFLKILQDTVKGIYMYLLISIKRIKEQNEFSDFISILDRILLYFKKVNLQHDSDIYKFFIPFLS